MATIGVSSSGTTFFSGTVSGIDTKSLIENAVNAKLLPRKRLLDLVTKNTNKITGLQKLQTQANALKASFDKLKKDLILPNVFAGKQATYATSNASVTAASVLTATVGSTALAGSNTVVVNSLAKSFVAQGTNQASSTTALGFTGSFDIGEAGKTAVTINVTNSSTLTDIAAAINATAATSGVNADILQVTPGVYRLVIRGADTAKAVNVTNITGSNVLNSLGVTDGAGVFTDVVQPPVQASVTLNGISVLSDTNKLSNVLTGVTVDLLSASPGTTITINIGNDTDSVKAAIKSVVDNYNTLRQTISDLKKVSADGQVDEKAFLFNEGINTSLGQKISALVSGTYGSSSSYNGLSSIGVTLDASNNLVIDSAKLDGALKNNFNDVKSIFATSAKFSATSNLQSSDTSGLGYTGSFDIGEQGKTAVTINVTGGSTLQSIRNSINAASATSGVSASITQLSSGEFRLVLSGADDSTAVQVTNISGTDVLTSLGLTSSAGVFTNNTSTVGLADTASGDLDIFSNTVTGSLAKAVQAFQSTNTDLTKKSDAIKVKVDAFQEQLIQKYAKLEALIKGADTVKKQIKAILDGTSSR